MNTPRIPAGTYKGRAVAGSEQYVTSKNGHDQIVIELDLHEIGEHCFTYLTFSDKAAAYSMDRLRALGWQGTDLTALKGIDSNEVDVSVTYREFEGKTNMNVDIVTGGTRAPLKNALDEKGKRAFASKYADLAKTTAPVANSGAQPKKPDIAF